MAAYTKKVKIGNIFIGGGEPVAIQSMTNTKTEDAEATIIQIKELQKAGCEIVRVTVPTNEAAENIGIIKKNIGIPLVADIHYDYRLAVKSIKNGVDKLRINPGNIGSDENIRSVVDAAKDMGVPIRIGVNGGSLEKHILEKYGRPTDEALLESAMYHVGLLEKFGFENIVISLKASEIKTMVNAYRKISKKVNYPLHLGVTEAGTMFQGTVKSSIGIGALLVDDIGDTIRVSLTEDPVEEIRAAREILKVLELRKEGIEIISCPTCGRTEIDLINLAKRVEKEFADIKKHMKVAVMGCVVNGPGEAKGADVGIAGGKGIVILFKNGEIVKTVDEDKAFDELRRMIEEY